MTVSENLLISHVNIVLCILLNKLNTCTRDQDVDILHNHVNLDYSKAIHAKERNVNFLHSKQCTQLTENFNPPLTFIVCYIRCNLSIGPGCLKGWDHYLLNKSLASGSVLVKQTVLSIGQWFIQLTAKRQLSFEQPWPAQQKIVCNFMLYATSCSQIQSNKKNVQSV